MQGCFCFERTFISLALVFADSVSCAGLEFEIILFPEPPECWDYNAEPSNHLEFSSLKPYVGETGLNSPKYSRLP